jgi:5'-AMP-activated protein kinase catalytic alpha subunit
MSLVGDLGKYLLQMDHHLGSGASCTVKLGRCKSTGEPVAIKIINKSRMTAARLSAVAREVDILLHVSGHPNIVKLLDVIDKERFLFLIFEYKERNLRQYLAKLPDTLDMPTVEQMTRTLLFPLVESIDHCHRHGVVHRDVKLENILLDSDGSGVVLADFGLSAFAPGPGSELLSDWCGSVLSAAPEILTHRPYRGPEVDVWSLGTVIYACLCGRFPFEEEKMDLMIRRTVYGERHPFPGGLSPEAMDVVERCLTVDPKRRITMSQLKAHPFWYSERTTIIAGRS